MPPYPEAREGNGADVLGGIALFPEDRVLGSGLGYTAELSDGSVLRGELKNRIGRGWTPVDGYGLIDAEEAVKADKGGARRRPGRAAPWRGR